jgi:magnesium-transporting ATPase (P-type)
MDKTGTLTQGVFQVQKIVPANFLLETDLSEPCSFYRNTKQPSDSKSHR